MLNSLVEKNIYTTGGKNAKCECVVAVTPVLGDRHPNIGFMGKKICVKKY